MNITVCLKLSTEEIACAIVGGLLHDIGMEEMPSILKMEELPPQEEVVEWQNPGSQAWDTRDSFF